uniref:Uncharacterized protein n=1 Tax=Ditylenchus dipsaci TaxID=166011 RepID=A0A915E0S1_9BILA
MLWTRFVNAQADESTDDETDFASQIEDLRKEMRDGFEEKDRVIDEQRKELSQQRRFISSIVGKEMSEPGVMAELDQISTNCRISATKKLVKRKACQIGSKDASVIVIASGSSSVKIENKEIKQEHNDIFSHDKTIAPVTKRKFHLSKNQVKTSAILFVNAMISVLQTHFLQISLNTKAQKF